MIYRKRGVTERWENGTYIEVRESGVAIEDGDFFECYPYVGPSLALTRKTPPRIDVPHGVHIERYLYTHGVAAHEYGDKQWREETERVHIALVRDRVRVLLDDLGSVAPAADALMRLDDEREAPQRLVLAPNVTAALIPSLLDLAPPNIRLVQTAGGIDGKGNAIEETTPNWYRPSYRVRPVQMPLNVRIECDVTEIEPGLPRAVALIEPVRRTMLRVLIDDGVRAYPANVRVARIDAVAGERTWYPYGGGSFGAEMML